MDLLDFSEEEIQEQLAVLGYRNIPKHKLGEFKRDLDQLIQHEKLKIQYCSSELNTSSSSSRSQQAGGLKTTTTTSPQQVGGLKTTTTTTSSSPPAYTKEKVSLDSLRAGGRLFLHVGTAEHHRQVLSPSGLNRQPDTRDSYACHTVGPRPPQPPTAPHRLHVLPDPGPPPPDPPAVDRLPLPTSQASSPEGGGHGKPFITRKVLRKHNGQVFVCDESIHSEDSGGAVSPPDLRAPWLNPLSCPLQSHLDGSGSAQPLSLLAAMYELCPSEEEEEESTSFHSSWSHGEEEEEEEVVVERVCREEGSTRTPLNLALTSSDIPPLPTSQWESSSSSHRGEASHGSGDEDDGEDGDDEDDGCDDGVRGGVDEGDKVQPGEDGGSPAPSHLTSGYGTYRPDSPSKDTEAGTIGEFDRETLAGDDEEDEEDLHRFYCDDPSPTPRLQDPLPPLRSLDPLPPTWSPDPRRDEEEEECGGGEDRKCLAPDRKSSAAQSEGPLVLKAAAPERLIWRSAGDDDHRRASELEERWTDGPHLAEGRDLRLADAHDFHLVEGRDLNQEEEEEEEEKEDLEDFCSNTDIRFIDSDLKPGCAGAVGSLEERGNLRPRAQDVSGLEQRLGGLRVSATSARRRGDDLDDDLDEDTENDDITRQSGDITSQSDAGSSDGLSLSAFESFVRGVVRMQTEGALKPRPKSFIRPALSHPHTRNLKKTDPVARYFQYKQEWDMFKVPGEKDRRALHWEIRERLAYQPPPVRPRRVYAPNSYIVPTEKKRSALRWEVRNDLANGLLPPPHNYRF